VLQAGLTGIEFQQMDAEKLELKNESFDAVLSLFALRHFPRPSVALKEMYRVLRPGGRLVVAIGSGPPLRSFDGLKAGLQRLIDMIRTRQGKRLIACDFLNGLVQKRLPESAEPEEARKRDAKSKDKVEVYLAKGEKDAHSSTNVPLSQIELEDVPLFTSDDVLHYDIDSDRFILNDTAYEAIQRVKLSVFGRSFVLMVGKRRVYKGALWDGWSSVTFDGVLIVRPMDKANTELQLELGYPNKEQFTGQDPRHDPEVPRRPRPRAR